MSNLNPQDPDPGQQIAAGWFPVGNGVVRYWDGANWTDHVAPDPNVPRIQTNDDNTLAILCHAGGAFLSVLVPLIIFLTKRDQSPYVRHHALEALNFHVTMFLALLASLVLMLVLIGFILLFVVIIGFYVLSIVASVAASRGEWYRYPFALRLFT